MTPLLEHLIPTPNGRKTNAKNEPVRREKEAIEDIENATGLNVDFKDYEK